jgi:Protein of unknown function (DUF3054)
VISKKAATTRMAGGVRGARSVVIAAVLDVLLVVVFVLIGRSSHKEGFSLLGALTTAWPFLTGLIVGWFVTRSWRDPTGIVWTGLGIWVSTVAVGVLLRSMSGQGVQPSFVIVTTIVLGLFLMGWRGIALLQARRATSAVSS